MKADFQIMSRIIRILDLQIATHSNVFLTFYHVKLFASAWVAKNYPRVDGKRGEFCLGTNSTLSIVFDTSNPAGSNWETFLDWSVSIRHSMEYFNFMLPVFEWNPDWSSNGTCELFPDEFPEFCKGCSSSISGLKVCLRPPPQRQPSIFSRNFGILASD